MPAWLSVDLVAFFDETPESIADTLAGRATERGLPGNRQSWMSWRESAGILQVALREAMGRRSVAAPRWGLLLEFEIPRRRRRPDAILLAGDAIFVCEFKIGSDRFERADHFQVEEYARDLADFHEASHGRTLIPVLIASEAEESDVDLEAPNLLDRAQLVAPADFGNFLTETPDKVSRGTAQISREAWENSRYRPTPSILEAAREVYAGHSVREISQEHTGNLTRTADELRATIARARASGERIICFVTGVPGSGKTLAGLESVHNASPGLGGEPLGVYLSGNGPLVKVLQYAIAVDLVEQKRARGEKSSTSKELRQTETFIQSVHGFIDELGASGGSPPENVIVFDEAQRAWDADKMQRKGRPEESEAGIALDIMARADEWAVIIALIGAGQEIHDGEAGIEEWFRALGVRPNWKVHTAPEVHRSAQDLARRPARLSHELHLATNVRAPRARALSDWASAFVERDVDGARRIARDLEDFPLLITRSLDNMRNHLRERTRKDRRPGLLASSQARRLRAFGIEMSGDFQGGVNWPRWFVDSAEEIRSSYPLEVAASEFACQGLELDWVGLCWGGDLLPDPESCEWAPRRLRGGSWNRDSKVDYAVNRYRVLLTRARFGMVIWVPAPGANDPLLEAPGFDAIAEELVEAGCSRLEFI